MPAILEIKARQILDSRGNPTVEAEVLLEDGTTGRGSSPSGASTGSHEAVELRDNIPNLYKGKSVLEAVSSVNGEIAEVLIGREATEQARIDKVLVELDGTKNKSRLGANSILAVSIAIANAAAKSSKQPLYRYLGGIAAQQLPIPMMNIINGGIHANNTLDIQEFMIMPIGASAFTEALQWGVEVFQCLKIDLEASGYGTTVGDEGGFAPNIATNRNCLDLMLKAVEKLGLNPGSDISFALDVAATELFDGSKYCLQGEGKKYTSDEFIIYLEKLSKDYPIFSIEDGLAEDDWAGWSEMTQQIGENVQLVGDDLFVTNTERIKIGIEERTANSVLIKMNQIGTITETLAAVELTKNSSMQAIVSHRSGETEDTTIADLAVATNCGQIKAGSVTRTDRVGKYNQLVRIEEELGSSGVYATVKNRSKG